MKKATFKQDFLRIKIKSGIWRLTCGKEVVATHTIWTMDKLKILGKLKTKKLKWIINVQGLRSAICDFVSEVMFGLVVTFYPADAQGILQDMYVLNTALEMLADCELQ